MFSKLLDAYRCAFVWGVSQLVRGANAPREKWNGYVGDAIWGFSFLVTGIFVFLHFIAMYRIPHGYFGVPEGLLPALGVLTYFIFLALNYFYFVSVIGYRFIYENLDDVEYLKIGKKIFFRMMLVIIVLFISVISMIVFFPHPLE